MISWDVCKIFQSCLHVYIAEKEKKEKGIIVSYNILKT